MLGRTGYYLLDAMTKVEVTCGDYREVRKWSPILHGKQRQCEQNAQRILTRGGSECASLGFVSRRSEVGKEGNTRWRTEWRLGSARSHRGWGSGAVWPSAEQGAHTQAHTTMNEEQHDCGNRITPQSQSCSLRSPQSVAS